jgi:hypothetical protein
MERTGTTLFPAQGCLRRDRSSATLAEHMKRVLAVVGMLMLVYACCYMVQSVCGAYVPYDEGLGGVKHYIWAPRGLADAAGRPRLHCLLGSAFMPLWCLDDACWHTGHNLGGH